MSALQPLEDGTFRAIAAAMQRRAGLSFGDVKKPLVVSRLARRLEALALTRFEDYLERLLHDVDGEQQVALDLLTTNETYFFREPAHFDVLADWLRQRRPAPLAVWSAASSFGDEAYSIAMLLDELQARGQVASEWSILGTDISDRVLRSAVEAVYPMERLNGVGAERLQRHCLRGEGDAAGLVQMHPRLRARVSFGQLNLCRPIEPLGPFDVIFLRNVLIYFDAPTKQAVVERVLERLRPGGLLFLGTAEGRPPGTAGMQVLRPGAFLKPVR